MITGRCYCGHVALRSEKPPLTVAFCHCSDCKRWTGAPAPGFAAFSNDALGMSPDLGEGVVTKSGIERWNCPKCGSPIAARFDYIPDQTYVPLGLIDQADALPAQIHCHAEQRLRWLHIEDSAARQTGSARAALNARTS